MLSQQPQEKRWFSQQAQENERVKNLGHSDLRIFSEPRFRTEIPFFSRETENQREEGCIWTPRNCYGTSSFLSKRRDVVTEGFGAESAKDDHIELVKQWSVEAAHAQVELRSSQLIR